MTAQPILIPFNKLVPSAANVRRVKTDLTPLVASLRADGILQNLIVVACDNGRYAVVAGERRRRAAAVLVRDGTWPRNIPIPCETRGAGDAVAVSFAENAQRVAMHPADACRAFAMLAGEGLTPAAIAHRYGYEPAEVMKLLRLGTLPPKVLKALAEDRIDVAFAQALTLTDDPELQEAVLKRAGSGAEARRLLTQTKIATSDRRFRFIADAYAAAGGAVTRDLFAAEGAGYADDVDLVQKLVAAKLEGLAEGARADGWGAAIAEEREPYAVHRWERLHPTDTRPPTPAEAERLAAAAGEIAALEAATEPTADARARLWAQRRVVADIERACRTHTPEEKAGGILVICLDADGGVREAAYTRDRPRAAAKAPAAERPLYPAALVEDLSKVRTRALQLALAQDPTLALDVLLDVLLALTAARVERHAVQLRADGFSLRCGEGTSERDIAAPAMVAADLLEAMPQSAADRWDWLRALEPAAKARLLAAATAGLVNGIVTRSPEPGRLASVERIARAAALDMSAHWQGGTGFFARLTKRACLAALEEALGQGAADNCAKLGKAALAETCAARLAGTGWLPPALRLAPVVAKGDEGDAPVERPVADPDAAA